MLICSTRATSRLCGAKIQCTKGRCSKAFHMSCARDSPDVKYTIGEAAELKEPSTGLRLKKRTVTDLYPQRDPRLVGLGKPTRKKNWMPTLALKRRTTEMIRRSVGKATKGAPSGNDFISSYPTPAQTQRDPHSPNVVPSSLKTAPTPAEPTKPTRISSNPPTLRPARYSFQQYQLLPYPILTAASSI
ncbi:unnamed protein product [Rhizoctonia solani]|uniref:PHD-type domain-containing protein n=1 Tax=Rhizoctonia solani TaxID=456999 RepID=A0A8H3BY64_9AGAM|nr:unnamed protein product [Rhizoctonia solani]CAE6466712.1 unnamed protein product [Rhizoctonia solani]